MNKLLSLFCLLALTVWLPPASGAEPARDFLKGLRDRGFHDVALDYLDTVQKSSLVDVKFKQIILYEKGVTLIEASRVQRDQAIREKYLNDAADMLKQFAASNAIHPLANSAQSQLGNLIVERARMLVEQSKKGNKQQLLGQASKLYEEAFGVFSKLQESVKVQLERIPKVLDKNNKQQAAMIERRTQLRADYLQTQLLAAAIREETAETHAEGSAKFKEVLTEAAGLYDEVYKKYRTRLAGLYARLYQGRANQRVGKLKDALGYYGELLDQPDDPQEFRVLKTKTLRLAMEAWLDPSEEKYVEAIKRADEWVKKSRATEDRETDWLAIRMSLAKAYKMQADNAEEGDARTKTQSISAARQQAQFVASRTSEFQDAAKQMVADLGGPDRTGEEVDPKTFAEARDAGKDALDSIQTATLVVTQVPARIAKEQDEKVKEGLEQQLTEAQNTLATAQTKAIGYYNLALQLADRETSIEDINVVRYFLCYLYYLEKDYHKAALMGEFVSQRYPDSAGARQCAKIALACYIQIYGEGAAHAAALFKQADADSSGSATAEELGPLGLPETFLASIDGSVSVDEFTNEMVVFEINHIVSVAEYTADKWPDQPEAEEALNTLVPFMINAGELERAQEFLARIPEDSPKRRDSELKTGQAMWGTYLRDSQKMRETEEAGGDVTNERTRLDQLKGKAEEVLTAAYGRVDDKVKPDRTVATALLSLAQARLEAQNTAEAAEVLEHASIGPLTLVNKKHPSVKDPALSEEIYKTALRTYISSLGSGGDEAIEKAKGVMEDMKAALSASGGEDRLIGVYVNLARDLEAQLESAPADKKLALSKGFETFLQQLNEGATELSVLNWVAESFSKLGAGLDDGDTLNEEAKRYYQASIDAFQNIIDKVDLEDQMKVQIQIRMATINGEMREFDKAIGVFEQVLAANPMMLNVQVEAAKLLETWAEQPDKSEKYMEAIKGVFKAGEGKPVIWGWGKIAQTTARFEKFRDTFHESRIHLAKCRFLYAQTKAGQEKDKLTKDALQDISLTKRLFPTLGGEKWTAQYDTLLKQIQGALGERPIGLQAFEQPTAGAAE